MKQGYNYIIVYVPKYANDLPPNSIYLYEGRKAKELALKGVNEPPTALTERRPGRLAQRLSMAEVLA